jgi:hypothetical protein
MTALAALDGVWRPIRGRAGNLPPGTPPAALAMAGRRLAGHWGGGGQAWSRSSVIASHASP